jgi:hypothetical protein
MLARVKVTLSATPPPATRVLATITGVFMIVFGLAFTVLPLVADRMLRDACGPAGISACANGLGPVRWVGLLGVLFALTGAFAMLHTLRRAAWLDGTVLSVRGALGTRSADLADAGLRLTHLTRRTAAARYALAEVPYLIAGAPDGRTLVALALRLPGDELRALADTITACRPATDAEAVLTATQLRTLP